MLINEFKNEKISIIFFKNNLIFFKSIFIIINLINTIMYSF